MSFESRLAEYRLSLTGDFIPAEEANKFVKSMKSRHKREFTEWVEANAVRFVTDRLSEMLRGERRTAVSRAGARAFSGAAQAASQGDPVPIAAFAVVYEVNADHTRRAVGDMTGPDHRYVAEGYTRTGNRALLLAECHRVVAKRVKLRRTADVLSEEQYVRVFDSILGTSDVEAAA